MTPQPIAFEVGDPGGLGEACTIAGSLFLPPPSDAPPSLVMVMIPGGTYTRGYYHHDIPGHPDHSIAAHFAERGAVVVTVDNLGTGESSRPVDGTRVSLDAMAGAHARVVQIVRERLAKGELGVAPVAQPFVVGVGHSLGGYLTQIIQGDHGGFDAVAILGSTCQTMLGTEDPDAPPREILPAEEAGYFLFPRAQNHGKFHYPDVPAEVIAADDETFTVLPMGMMEVGVPGRTVPQAAAITVPVFLAFGTIDLSPDPYKEPEFYRGSPDVTLFMLETSGHCHNTASTRGKLWRRIGAWIDGVRR